MKSAVPILLLLSGCCARLFSEADYTTRVYQIQDVMDRLKIDEEGVRNRLDTALSKEGYQSDIVDMTPQKGMLVIQATKEAHERIKLLLIEMER